MEWECVWSGSVCGVRVSVCGVGVCVWNESEFVWSGSECVCGGSMYTRVPWEGVHILK